MLLAVSAIDFSATPLAVPEAQPLAEPPAWFVGPVMVFTVLAVVLSYWPVRNLMSRRQRMNVTFNPYHLVNSYGAFGGIGRSRREVVIEGTDDAEITAETVWKEYEFKGKPGSVGRLPRQWAPYHLRLDWLMWFAALSPAYAQPWFDAFLERLLRNDRPTLRLLRRNPFSDAPPRYVRARLYRYRFTTPRELWRDHVWWHRTLDGEYIPAVALADN